MVTDHPTTPSSRSQGTRSSAGSDAITRRRAESRQLLDRARTVAPIEMVQRLFPELECKRMSTTRDQWKVYINEVDRLIITGEFFGLNWTKNGKGRFFGAGSINLWSDLKNVDRDQNFMEAAKAINEAFFNGVTFDNSESLRAQLEARKKRAEAEMAKQSAPVVLPAKSEKAEDAAAIQKYLVEKRGLSESLVQRGMETGAIYATREHPNFKNIEGRTPDSLGVVFALLHHQDDSYPAFAWRDINSNGQYSKINRGPKTHAAFRLGAFDSKGGKLTVTESAIEALSYWDFHKRTDPAHLKQRAVVGMSGEGDPSIMLAAAKARGITHVEAAYNNDIAGRAMNDKLIEAAKDAGLTTSKALFYGELNWSWRDIPEHDAQEKLLQQELERQQIPYADLDPEDIKPGWKSIRLPNIQAVRALIPELKKLRMAEDNFFIRKEHLPTLGALLDSWVKKGQAQHYHKSFPSGDRWTILRTPEARAALEEFKKTPSVIKGIESRQMNHDSSSLADAEWLNKDWNDQLKGNSKFLLRDHPKVLAEWPKQPEKVSDRER